MLSEAVISFEKVNKQYAVGMPHLFGDKHLFHAVQNISFRLKKGSTLGIIGPNGSGKSTILKLLAGVTYPDAGTITVNGRIAPLIELGAGFHPELTGRENIYLNGTLLGLKKKQIDSLFEQIVDFAGIKEFIDIPVKKYSSGMFVKLGFSLSTHTDPDILLVDEVLAVGDEGFQRKCIEKFVDFKKAGKTIVVVSHDLGLISSLCDEAMLLSGGEIVEYGSTDSAISHYLQMVLGDDKGSAVIKTGAMNFIFNNGRAAIFWNGKELTKKWGIYTSILMSKSKDMPRIWQDSTRAIWTCSRLDDKRLMCRGEFISAPMSQEWNIRLPNDNKIEMTVTLKTYDSIFCERRQTNVMLSEKYTVWKEGCRNGMFPEKFTARDYHNWDILHAAESAAIQVESVETLPSVEFLSYNKTLAAVVNSNFFFGGRVLMHLDTKENELSHGEYEYFRGEITINA
jgi:ABC-type polysaccharide/polyol phosphate transport system ATPase subunit